MVGVIGSPIAHSLSPLLHNAAFAALGLGATWHSFAFEVAPGQAAEALAAMRRADISGLSVTMPHKADVAALVDECTEVARRLDAVNCIVNRNGVLLGTNTDGEGFVASLARGAGFAPAGRRCLVIGAGGAARAVVLALADAGASRGGGPQPDARTGGHGRRAGRPGGVGGPAGEGALAEAVGSADLVVNATPVGMAGASPEGPSRGWWRRELLHAGQVAADLVYAPRPTAWLVEAAAAGARAVDGLGMLVHQAAAQLVLWTGEAAPVEAMWRGGGGGRSRPESRGLRTGDRVRPRAWPAARPRPARASLRQRLQRRLAQGPGQRVALRRDGEQRDAHGDRGRVGALQPDHGRRLGAVPGEGGARRHLVCRRADHGAQPFQVGGAGTGQGEVDDGAGPAPREVADEADVAVGDDEDGAVDAAEAGQAHGDLLDHAGHPAAHRP